MGSGMSRLSGTKASAQQRSDYTGGSGQKGRAPLSPPSPGEVLRNLMSSDPKITQNALADALGVSRLTVNQLINGRRNLTADMAVLLGAALNTTAEFWLNLQQAVDLH